MQVVKNEGDGRIVHVRIANPSVDSQWPTMAEKLSLNRMSTTSPGLRTTFRCSGSR